jgi:hypothetical protein
MPVNLLAICRQNDAYLLKRVKVTAKVQDDLEGIFIQQEQEFFEAITDEVLFDGGWRPEPNELLYVPAPPEAASIMTQAQANLVSLPDLNAAHFRGEGIRALCVLMTTPTGNRLLIQNFSGRQILAQRFNLILDGDTFSHLSQPAFTIGTSLAGVIEDSRLKFNSYNNIRMIFDLKNLYKEATDAQLDAFIAHPALTVADPATFKVSSDQSVRKLVHAISERGILDIYAVNHIVQTALSEGIDLQQQNGQIIMLTNKADIKRVLISLTMDSTGQPFPGNPLLRIPRGAFGLLLSSQHSSTYTLYNSDAWVSCGGWKVPTITYGLGAFMTCH